jgi:hypothetical protein
MNPLSINDEYNQMRSPQQEDADYNILASSSDSDNADEIADRANLNEWVNDFSHLLRGTDGSIHPELRPDTLVTINGMEMTYEVAKVSGLLNGDQQQTQEDSDPLRANIPNTVEISAQVQGQNAYAENLVGKEAFESALMGDETVIADISKMAGVDENTTMEMINETISELEDNAIEYVQERFSNINVDHMTEWFRSTAVPKQQRLQVIQSLRRGHFDGVEALLNQYRTDYELR